MLIGKEECSKASIGARIGDTRSSSVGFNSIDETVTASVVRSEELLMRSQIRQWMVRK